VKRRTLPAVGRILPAIALMLASCTTTTDPWRPVVGPPELRGPLAQRHVDDHLVTPAEVLGEPGDTSSAGPLVVTIEDAVLQALSNNRAIRVQRLDPPIQRTFIEQERAAFDPVIDGETSISRTTTDKRNGDNKRTTKSGGSLGVSEYLPTGTTIEAEVATERDYGAEDSDQHRTGAEITVTQALLEGRGVAVNLASLRQARLDAIFSDYEFRGFAEAMVAEVEATYWQYVLARKRVEIVTESLKLAEQQLDETRRRIDVGDLPEIELAAGEAEIALRREALIDARSAEATLQVRLLRLIRPGALSAGERNVVPASEPLIPPVPLEEVSDHVAVALQMRPELHQAKLLIQRNELEIVKTRNGLLPQLDLFVTLGKTGYASTFSGSLGDIDSDGYKALIGLRFSQPVVNRDDRARHARAVLTSAQRAESLANLRDLVRQDVELAFIEVGRARQQVDATAVTRRFQAEKLRAETASFRVGRSTALLVAAAQRDLLASQVAEVEAIINYLLARIYLYHMEGSLLARRGLAAPGAISPDAESPTTTQPVSSPTPAR